MLVGLPDGPWRRQQELDLQIALGPALAGTKGFAADDVREAIGRARELAEQIDRPEYLVPLMDGLWAYGRFISSDPSTSLHWRLRSRSRKSAKRGMIPQRNY
jgi:hypothetical protein